MDPIVSVIIPCLNEAGRILGALDSLVDDWVLAEGEVLVVDGGSLDGTCRIVEEFAKKRGASEPNDQIKLIDSPCRLQVFGLNAGIRKARGEIIVRADAHCLYPPGYVKSCVDLLKEKAAYGAANVGGIMEPRGSGYRQKAIAMAMQHPLGVGDARFHLGTKSGFVDTVYLGTFQKRVLEEIGLYDTRLRTNEDAELNMRLLQAGWKIYLDHELRVVYFPRKTFSALARQYFAYGRGRAFTTRKHRRVSSWRQVVPPIVIPVLAAAALSGAFVPLLLLLPAGYLVTIFLVALLFPVTGWGQKPTLPARLCAAWAMIVMHVSWGIGFDLEFIRLLFGRRP